MLIIGSHVSFKKDTQLVGSVKEALSYGANTFMFYTGAPQNTNRAALNSALTLEAKSLMDENNIDINNVIVHAPYIINLANGDESKYKFSINFLKQECKRCEELGISKLVLHPGSHVGQGVEVGLKNIINALKDSKEFIDKIHEIENSNLGYQVKCPLCLNEWHFSEKSIYIKELYNYHCPYCGEDKTSGRLIIYKVQKNKSI